MKKFSAFLVCLLMIITCALTGCATFSIDKVKYYNEVVATVGEEKITRYDLLNAYSSYGQNYYASQLGQSEQDALKSTLDLLTKRESLFQYAKINVELTAYDVNTAVEEMFTSIDEQMASYVATAKTIFNITSTVSPANSDNETAYKLSDYYFEKSRRAKLSETDNTKIEYIVSEKSYSPVIAQEFLEDPFKTGVVDEVVEKYLARFEKSLINETRKEDLYNKAISLLGNILSKHVGNGTACRIGGDEFLIFLCDSDEEQSIQIVEGIISDFKEQKENGRYSVPENTPYEEAYLQISDRCVTDINENFPDLVPGFAFYVVDRFASDILDNED